MALGTNERELSPFEMLTLGPGPSLHLTTQLPSNQDSGLWCNESSAEVVGVEGPKPTSRKRLGKEIGKIGRNIRQRLLCAVFDKEAKQEQDGDDQEEYMETDLQSRHREAGMQQLPQQP